MYLVAYFTQGADPKVAKLTTENDIQDCWISTIDLSVTVSISAPNYAGEMQISFTYVEMMKHKNLKYVWE